MKLKLFPIAVIVLVTIAISAGSFHRHADFFSMAKCPSCSGKYVSASTHVNLELPEITRPEETADAPFAAVPSFPCTSAASTIRDRAPPFPFDELSPA